MCVLNNFHAMWTNGDSKMQLFSIYDSKSETHTAPTANPTKAQAIRSFSDAVNSGQDSVLTQHPADFTLFHIGSFDVKFLEN